MRVCVGGACARVVQNVLGLIKKRTIAEHLYCGNTLPHFIKLEKVNPISILISVHLRFIQS